MGKTYKFPYIRYWFAAVTWLGISLNFAMRLNLSVAIVAMVNSSAIAYKEENISTSQQCKTSAEGINSSSLVDIPHMEGEFAWSPQVQELILAAFFYGYPLLQVVGGRFSEMYSGKWLFGIATFVQVILVLLTPVATRLHVAALITIRVLEGMAQGVVASACYNLMSHWIPDNEKQVIGGLIFSGCSTGTVAGLASAGYLCKSTFFGGWPSAFYFLGAFGCVWLVFWCLLVTNTPHTHPFITDEEIHHITSNQKKMKGDKPPPIKWCKVMKSLPFWAIIVGRTGGDFGYFLSETNTAIFFSTILGFDVKMAGLLSSLPFIVKIFVYIFTGFVCDVLVRKSIASVRHIRIICTILSYFVPALFLLGVYLADCDVMASLICVMCFIIFYTFCGCGQLMSPLDISPEYAGTITGLASTVASATGIVSPFLVGALTDQNQTMEQWNKVFGITATLQILSGLFFLCFFSTEKQNYS